MTTNSPVMRPATATGASTLATNKVLRNTYGLLSMTLLFSAATAGVSLALNLPHPGLLLTLTLTLLSTLLYLSFHTRQHVVKPINRICDKLSSVNAHDDLAIFQHEEWRIAEFNSLESAFSSQHNKLLNAYTSLQQKAELDPLTHTYNRFRLPALLQGAVSRAKRQQKPLVLALIDLDQFKEINDKHGHDAGDMALKRFARQMLKVIRGSDALVRLGGDEFLLIAEECSIDLSQQLFDRLRVALDQAEEQNPLGFSISFSVGVAEYPTDTQDSDALIKQADARMYAQKQSRRSAT